MYCHPNLTSGAANCQLVNGGAGVGALFTGGANIQVSPVQLPSNMYDAARNVYTTIVSELPDDSDTSAARVLAAMGIDAEAAKTGSTVMDPSLGLVNTFYAPFRTTRRYGIRLDGVFVQMDWNKSGVAGSGGKTLYALAVSATAPFQTASMYGLAKAIATAWVNNTPLIQPCASDPGFAAASTRPVNPVSTMNNFMVPGLPGSSNTVWYTYLDENYGLPAMGACTCSTAPLAPGAYPPKPLCGDMPVGCSAFTPGDGMSTPGKCTACKPSWNLWKGQCT